MSFITAAMSQIFELVPIRPSQRFSWVSAHAGHCTSHAPACMYPSPLVTWASHIPMHLKQPCERGLTDSPGDTQKIAILISFKTPRTTMSSNLDPRKSVRLRDRLPWRRTSPRPSDNTTVSSSISGAASQNTPSSSQTNKFPAQIAGPSNVSSLQNAPSGPSAATAAIPPGQKLLNEALNELSPTQQALIRGHLGSGSDVIDAINKSCDAAKAKQEEWMKTRARCTFRGREFVFAEEADTVFRLLDKVSSVGDMVAASDPIHIGLPWTGVRFILQVCLAGGV